MIAIRHIKSDDRNHQRKKAGSFMGKDIGNRVIRLGVGRCAKKKKNNCPILGT